MGLDVLSSESGKVSESVCNTIANFAHRASYFSMLQATRDSISKSRDDANTQLRQPRIIRRASIADSVIGPDAFNTGNSFNPKVTFEEYLYWAQVSRADQRYEDPSHNYMLFGRDNQRLRPPNSRLFRFWASSSDEGHPLSDHSIRIKSNSEDGKNTAMTDHQLMPDSVNNTHTTRKREPDPRHIPILNEEYIRASRAVRTASWTAVFYLLTMDILGPFSVPWAFAAVSRLDSVSMSPIHKDSLELTITQQLGYGPGTAIYTTLFILATYGGYMLWRIFLGMDSDRHPVRTYADLVFRIYGSVARHLVSLLQSMQLLFNVGIIILINGLSLEQIITGSGRTAVCFIVLCLVWAIAGKKSPWHCKKEPKKTPSVQIRRNR